MNLYFVTLRREPGVSVTEKRVNSICGSVTMVTMVTDTKLNLLTSRFVSTNAEFFCLSGQNQVSVRQNTISASVPLHEASDTSHQRLINSRC